MPAHSPVAQFLSCDWGTSAFRLHLVETVSGKSLASVTSPDGINAVHQAWQAAGTDRERFFLSVMRGQVAKLAAIAGHSLAGRPLVISGMVTASIGLREIPHQPMPFALDASDLRVERLLPVPDDFGPVLLVSGARTPADVMRGEEIQVVGAAALGAAREALYLLPGTHSKHVRVAGGRAVELRTYLTGEIFELLAKRSILAHSVEDAPGLDPALAQAAFAGGVAAGVRENLLHASFAVRVAELSGRRSRAEGFHYLSGLVIGTELRDLAASAVVLVGSPALTARYAAALRVLGHQGTVEIFMGEPAVLAGHWLVLARAGLPA